MHIRIARTTALTLALATPVLALAASFNARPGAWEMTTSTAMTGMPIPAEALAKMPAEQRARIEAGMQARAGRITSRVRKSCVTQADLDQNRILKSNNETGCTRKIVSSSASKVVVEHDCPAPHASTSRMTFEAPTPESLVATIDVMQGPSGHVHVDIKGRWLAASCAGITKGR